MPASRFQFRRANASAWTSANPTLAAGELGFELDTGKFKIGDGSTAWTSLNYSAVLPSSLAANVQTFLSTPSSSNLASAVTDETGSGALVFGTSPTLTTPNIGAATATSVNGTTIPSSKTLVVTTDKLSVLAPTSSSELAGVISDETGSGVLVFGTSPTISTPSIDNPKLGYTTTATAAGTTTLSSSSNYRQYFTGTTTQTITLPSTSTLVLGQAYEIHNLSTGALTINSSGSNLVATLEGGKSGLLTCISTSVNTAAAWDITFDGATTNTGTGALVFGTSPTISLPAIDNVKIGYTTTATAAGTTTLTSSSNYRQYFTGTSTQTVTLPVASTMALGQGFQIRNNSTGSVTVNSSGDNLVASVSAGSTARIVCILTSGTSAASWDVEMASDSISPFLLMGA